MPRITFAFEDLSVPADIDCPPDLLGILDGFGIAAHAAGDAGHAAITVRPADGRFRMSGPAYLSPFSVEGLDAVAGSVMAGLAACKALSLAGHMLCIHGAAAVIGARGYLFLAPFGTGKSSLVAELARRGASVLGDDVVLLDTRDGTMRGLRMPHRLRQSFVTSATPEMRDWIADRTVFAGPRYAYLRPHGLSRDEHALTDIVLLSRARDEPPAGTSWQLASPGMLVPRILWHNMSRHHAASSLAAMASALAEGARCSVLHAASVRQAAGLLLGGASPQESGCGHPPLSSTLWDDLHIMRTDKGAIVSDDQTGRIFEINESAFVILTLLQQSDDLQEIGELLRTLYPEAPEPELEAQLAACIRQFAECGILDVSHALPPAA